LSLADSAGLDIEGERSRCHIDAAATPRLSTETCAPARAKGPFSGRRGRQNLKCVRPDLEARMRAAGHEGRRRGLVHDDWL
jgi:hypothetical protein